MATRGRSFGTVERAVRNRLAAAVVVLVLAGTPAHADCPGPSFDAPRAVVAGHDLVVTGQDFAAECNDTGIGCLGPRRSPPSENITVELQGAFTTVDSAVVSADENYELEAVLSVPEDTEPGEYHVIVDDDDPGMVGSEKVIVRAP